MMPCAAYSGAPHSSVWTWASAWQRTLCYGWQSAARASAVEIEARIAARPLCLPPSETREEVKARHLLEPFKVLKSAAGQFKAEALSVNSPRTECRRR